jgi:NAD+ synthase
MKAAHVVDHILGWLAQYCDTANLKGFVVGVSGGIDSAVTSTLCARTGKTTLLLNMPIYQAAHQIDLARQHIQWIEGTLSQCQGGSCRPDPRLPGHRTNPAGRDPGWADHGQQPFEAAHDDALCLCHPSPPAGGRNRQQGRRFRCRVLHQIRRWGCRSVPDCRPDEIRSLRPGARVGIIDGIMQAPPTDGLWEDNRTDEGQIGASYPELEWAMQFTEKNGDEAASTPGRKRCWPSTAASIRSIGTKWNRFRYAGFRTA